MDMILLIARLSLGFVFAVAGLAKLGERNAFRATLSSFGFRRSLAWPLGLVVPLAELGVSCAVLIPSLARWGGLAALALLTAFSSALLLASARGREPDCDCFGRLELLSTGRRPLIRNGGLALLAVLIAVRGGASSPEGLAGPTALLLAVGVLLFALAFAMRLQGLRWRLEQGGTLENLPRPARGDRAPITVLTDLDGEVVDLRSADGSTTLLLFWNPMCAPCQYMLPHLKGWERKAEPGALRLVVTSSGTPEANRAAGLASSIVLDRSGGTAAMFGVPGRPAAVLLDQEGRLASDLILGAPAILTALDASRPA